MVKITLNKYVCQYFMEYFIMKDFLSFEEKLRHANLKEQRAPHAPILRESNKSFTQWATENRPFIESRLIDAGIAFLNEHAEDVPVPINSLITDNRWNS